MNGLPTLLLVLAAAPAADASPSPEQVRQSVERSLVFLEKSGMNWWKSEKCASCHHVPISVWSMSEAKNRGFSVSDDSLSQMRNGALSSYAEHPKLTPVGQDGKGLSMNTIYLTLAATSAARVDEKTAEGVKKFTAHLLAGQDADGSWKSSAKLPPVGDITEVRTMQVLLALSAAHDRGLVETAVWTPSRDRALAWLRQNKFIDQNQSLNLQVLVTKRFGKPEEVQTLVKQLLQQQNADGGWSQTRGNSRGPIQEYEEGEKAAAPQAKARPTGPAQESDTQKTEATAADPAERPSDALATGQTLYVLSMAGLPPQELAIQRALAFLVRTQTKDGSWRVPIRSQKNSGTALSHYGTGWAAIGIMQTLPAPATKQDNP